jgi:hypothetical protein
LNIVTDHIGFSLAIENEFDKNLKLFKSFFDDSLFVEKLPAGYGSSYYDRFWNNGNSSKRYFFKFKKI